MERLRAPVGASLDLLAGDLNIAALDEIEPRRTGGGEVQMEARVPQHPAWMAGSWFVRQFGEPALHEVQPGPIGRRDMDVEARFANQFRINGVLCVPHLPRSRRAPRMIRARRGR